MHTKYIHIYKIYTNHKFSKSLNQLFYGPSFQNLLFL